MGCGVRRGPGEDGYLSRADEICSLLGPHDGELLDSWELRLPTSLVWLDLDSSLPKYNDPSHLASPTEPHARTCRSNGEE